MGWFTGWPKRALTFEEFCGLDKKNDTKIKYLVYDIGNKELMIIKWERGVSLGSRITCYDLNGNKRYFYGIFSKDDIVGCFKTEEDAKQFIISIKDLNKINREKRKIEEWANTPYTRD